MSLPKMVNAVPTLLQDMRGKTGGWWHLGLISCKSQRGHSDWPMTVCSSEWLFVQNTLAGTPWLSMLRWGSLCPVRPPRPCCPSSAATTEQRRTEWMWGTALKPVVLSVNHWSSFLQVLLCVLVLLNWHPPPREQMRTVWARRSRRRWFWIRRGEETLTVTQTAWTVTTRTLWSKISPVTLPLYDQAELISLSLSF